MPEHLLTTVNDKCNAAVNLSIDCKTEASFQRKHHIITGIRDKQVFLKETINSLVSDKQVFLKETINSLVFSDFNVFFSPFSEVARSLTLFALTLHAPFWFGP